MNPPIGAGAIFSPEKDPKPNPYISTDGHPLLMHDRFRTPNGTILLTSCSLSRIDYRFEDTWREAFEARAEFDRKVKEGIYFRL